MLPRISNATSDAVGFGGPILSTLWGLANPPDWAGAVVCAVLAVVYGFGSRMVTRHAPAFGRYLADFLTTLERIIDALQELVKTIESLRKVLPPEPPAEPKAGTEAGAQPGGSDDGEAG